MPKQERSLAGYQQQRMDAKANIAKLQDQETSLKAQKEAADARLRQLIREEDAAYLQNSPAAVILRDLGVELAATGVDVYMSLVDPSLSEYGTVELSLVWDISGHGNQWKTDDSYGPAFEEAYTAGLTASSVDLVVRRAKSGEILGLAVNGSIYLNFDWENQRKPGTIIDPDASAEAIRAAIQAAIKQPNTKSRGMGDRSSYSPKASEKLYRKLLSNCAVVKL